MSCARCSRQKTWKRLCPTALPRSGITETPSSPGKLKGYLAVVVRNKALSALRSKHIESALEDDFIDLAAGSPEEGVLTLELRELAREAVDTLGEPDCEIFKRHYFLYQKTEDIAAALGMNGATVRTKLARGRQRLKYYLEERGYGNEA